MSNHRQLENAIVWVKAYKTGRPLALLIRMASWYFRVSEDDLYDLWYEHKTGLHSLNV